MTEYLKKYLPDIAHLEMSEDQKIELLRSVHLIMQNFIDRAFGIDPVQQALGYPPILPLAPAAKRIDSNTITKPDSK